MTEMMMKTETMMMKTETMMMKTISLALRMKTIKMSVPWAHREFKEYLEFKVFKV
jgi:hypothetical protein